MHLSRRAKKRAKRVFWGSLLVLLPLAFLAMMLYVFSNISQP